MQQIVIQQHLSTIGNAAKEEGKPYLTTPSVEKNGKYAVQTCVGKNGILEICMFPTVYRKIRCLCNAPAILLLDSFFFQQN